MPASAAADTYPAQAPAPVCSATCARTYTSATNSSIPVAVSFIRRTPRWRSSSAAVNAVMVRYDGAAPALPVPVPVTPVPAVPVRALPAAGPPAVPVSAPPVGSGPSAVPPVPAAAGSGRSSRSIAPPVR